MGIDYLAHLRADSARFAEVLAGADPDAPVPTCSDWTASDLLWHLGEVQHFWGSIVHDRLSDADAYQAPERPADTGASWLVQVGQWSGTSPNSGKTSAFEAVIRAGVL